MDCNKDEAVKAKGIAEKKLGLKDFVGAKKFALKAQQLYSELDGISQMLTVCNVHCSAEHKVLGTEMDWYRILQIEVTADEASVKKQYRKLALLLHPDKNKLEGAESAFKLIGEAHRVLSDSMKRSLYDMKYKAAMERARNPQQQNSTLPVRRPPGVSNSFGNINRTQFTSVNLHREQKPTGMDRPTFWTICPFCNMRYQYYREILNRALRCQHCSKPFIAYDLNVQGAPPGTTWTQPSVPQPAVPQPNSDGPKMGPQTTVPDFTANMGFQGHGDRGTAADKPHSNEAGTSKVNRGSKKKEEDGDMNRATKIESQKRDGDMNRATKRESQKRPKSNAETHNAGRKKKRTVVESSDSCDTASSSEELEIPEGIKRGVRVERDSGIPEGRTRRSSRQKREVIYNEDSDDDFVRSRRKNGSASFVKDQNIGTSNARSDGFSPDVKRGRKLKKQNRSAQSEEMSNDGNVQSESSESNDKRPDDEDIEEIIEETLNSDSSHKMMPDPEFIEVPDPDFYDFDKDRKEDCFKNDQMWAVYDNLDGMPRFYARIRKVLSPGFKVKITWLEASPDDSDQTDWMSEELPISCGTFKHEKTEITEDINMFSHSVTYEKSARRGFVMIHPRKGETWALFKDWNVNWSSDPDNHRIFEFDFVEILSDFDDRSGSVVAYLEKVKGFVSLFRPKKGVSSFQIPPNGLLRFSHRIPSYRTTGEERDAVPEGYFELDPASLPPKLLDPKAV